MDLRTECSTHAPCDRELLITFCHDSQYGKCCSTVIEKQMKKCHTSEYTANDLGPCAEFDFVSEKMLGSITFADTSDLADITGYGADWIKLALKDNTVLECKDIPWIQGDYTEHAKHPDVPSGVLVGNFVCGPPQP